MNKILNFKQNFWKISTLVLGSILLLSLVGNALLTQKAKNKSQNNTQSSLEANPARTVKMIEEVSAKDIYPLFECPCCGKSIDECTCGMAQERKNYVDVLIEVGENISEDEVILAYVKKYGLNSFMDKEKQEEFREKLVKEAPADRPIISINPDSYDFEDVSQKKGTVTTIFEIKNEGKNDLIIDRLESSCGCTSASVIYRGEEGPVFSMPGHGNGTNEEIGDWQVAIPPGETAQLKVYYDPNVHPDFRGAVTREVHVYSSDPIDFEKKATIELNQVD